MTRIQTFAESLVHDIIDAGDCHCGTSYVELKAVAERRLREFCQDAMWAARDPRRAGWPEAFVYLDEVSP